MKTSLGIWALGSMVTRFNPNGYKPEVADETPVERVRRAVEGLGDLIDGYEFHYPQEVNEGNLDDVRAALDGRFVRDLGLVAVRVEAGHHRPEGPDAKARLHGPPRSGACSR